ncbi:MAG: Uncharacterized protein G01um101420_846 [Parcubacteria group bacterium Gr01-1014_20]|nr:MAG: Uncharacterized protein G01um101420_846 [Parcubacteria group bacterium Gr01-1014_20]
MKLRGVEFGRVWGASGVQGFFGEGYWFHKLLQPFGLNWAHATFVAKTTTLGPRVGNMPLKSDFTPQEKLPKCIVVKPLKGVALNSVGLSGPGVEALLERGLWQIRKKPFLISFMSVADTPEKRVHELHDFVTILKEHLPKFQAPVGLQINYSCPNTHIHIGNLIDEVAEGLGVASELGIPLVPKFSVTLPAEVGAKIASNPACDAICISNTIPWGAFPEQIDWKGLFGSRTSPLAHLGGGGLSGANLLHFLMSWIRSSRRAGLRKPLNAGGGILGKEDASLVLGIGAESIFLGSIAFLRPWRVGGVIDFAHSWHMGAYHSQATA